MNPEDKGRGVVVIISERETVTGEITEVIGEHNFRVVSGNGIEYSFSDIHVAVKFKGAR